MFPDPTPLQFVLGMHRSGTSAMAGMLVGMGLHIGISRTSETVHNAKGYFENFAVMEFHDRLLKRLGSSWCDPRPLAPRLRSWPAEQLDALQREMALILGREFNDTPKGLVKDPRLCRLVPFWRPILVRTRFPLVMMLRHPASVAGSLRERDGFSADKSLLLWLVNNLELERETRNFPRDWVNYEELLSDPVSIRARLRDVLGLTNGGIDSVTNPGIDADLSHHDGQWPEASPWLRDLCAEAHATLKTGHPNAELLDRIFHDYERRVAASSDGRSGFPRSGAAVSQPWNTDDAPVQVQVFAQRDGGYSEGASMRQKASPFRWECVRFEGLGSLGLDPAGRLRIDPVECPGEVRIGRIRIHAPSDGRQFYLAESGDAFRSIEFLNGVQPFFEDGELRLLVSNNDPQLILPRMGVELPQDAVLEILLKISYSRKEEISLPERER